MPVCEISFNSTPLITMLLKRKRKRERDLPPVVTLGFSFDFLVLADLTQVTDAAMKMGLNSYF